MEDSHVPFSPISLTSIKGPLTNIGRVRSKTILETKQLNNRK